jgi:hypothetical protein
MSQTCTVRKTAWFLAVALLMALAGLCSAIRFELPDPDEETLRQAKVGGDGPALLAYIRERTPSDEDGRRVAALVKQLGDESFERREQASKALPAYGRLARGPLRAAAEDGDVEVAHRARRCLAEIESPIHMEVLLAVLRRIARRSPDGAAEVLLRFLPFADDEVIEEAVGDTLAAVAVRDGKADPGVVQALDDALTVRRAAAARALGPVEDKAVRARVRKLLRDAEARVRWEAARSLALVGDRAAVEPLIDLLRDAPSEIAGQAETLLFLIAGERAPQGSLGDGSAEARARWRDVWAKWWTENGQRTTLTKLDLRQGALGLVLMCETAGVQRVSEFGRDGKQRWEVAGFSWPMDVRVLPNGNILVADSSQEGVTERDRTGKVVWQARAGNGGAMSVQRLPNGNTFICEAQRLWEVDRAGQVVAQLTFTDTITDALRLPGGNVVYINTSGVLREIHWPTGMGVKALKLCDRQTMPTDWYRLEPAPGGRFLIAGHGDGRVFEIDAAGKVLWEHKVEQAYAATRLANGNVLIGTAESKRLIEVDRQHKVVQEQKTGGYVLRLRAR